MKEEYFNLHFSKEFHKRKFSFPICYLNTNYDRRIRRKGSNYTKF